MKNLVLKNMLLISHKEKKARKVKFHPEMNVIKGANDTGKSSLIKSIYYTFGATPQNMHKKWLDSNVAILINFSVDNKNYSIYRQKKSFTLFDSNNIEIGTYNSISKGIGPALANIFDFQLKLTDSKNELKIPPPAYLFLPFYIDQDKGWVQTWNSFESLGQFPKWKSPVVSYHFGLRPNAWYQLSATKSIESSKLEEPKRQFSTLNQIKKKINEQLSSIDFDIDVEHFKKEIKLLLDECEKIKSEQEKYKLEIVNLRTEKIRLEAQVEIVCRTHDELSHDYKYAVESECDEVSCPICGAEYSNSFVERFEIAKDTETCSDLLTSLKNDLTEINEKIISLESTLNLVSGRQNEIESLLSRKQGEVKLNDLLKIEGKKELSRNLEIEVESLNNQVGEINLKIQSISDQMSKYDNKDHKKRIYSQYEDDLKSFSTKLNVLTLDEKVFKKIDSSIKETGSDLPRAILAYNFSVLSAIEKNGNATFCPIIIDAPNQQEQDEVNLKKILEFISSNRPKNHQMILGLVEDSGINFGGQSILLDQKYSLLDKKQYDEVSNEIKYYESINLKI